MKGCGGVTFLGLLTLVFIACKLTHNIDWSWWWVFAPMWIPAALTLTFIVLVVTLRILVHNVKTMWKNEGS